jgi:hypothetical protein
MRTRWNPDKQAFEAVCPRSKAIKPSPRRRPKRSPDQKRSDYKGRRLQMNVRIPDNLVIALKRHHQSVCKSIGFNISLNEYMAKVIEAHLQSLGLEPLEAYDYSDPDLTTLHESLQYQ